MIRMFQQDSSMARAFPVSNVQDTCLNPVRNEQGLPGLGHTRLKKQAHHHQQMTVGTINIGTLTGKGKEIADLMERRRMDILCLQETRWKGNKAKELAGGNKLLYSGNNAGRNGVAVILLVNIREILIGVERRSDRVMSIKLRLDDTTLNVLSAYAPQIGCLEEEKDQFWDEVDQALYLIPQEEKVILAGDLNGHVGQSREGIKR